jgi:hypothetical protein
MSPTQRPHASTIDPGSRLFRKSCGAAVTLCYQDHVLMENRSGRVVSAVVTQADGKDERAAALAMLDTRPGRHPKTLGTNKANIVRMARILTLPPQGATP